MSLSVRACWSGSPHRTPHVRQQASNTAVVQALPTVVSVREGIYEVVVQRGVGSSRPLDVVAG
jgi:hypothetical protein